MNKPKLSIIIPMRPGVEESWFGELLKVEGDVEFITTYPPHVPFAAISDSRLRQIASPFRGEVVQRITSLLNATGEYVLSINCDEYIHPEIVRVAEDYFENFPDSYFFRLKQTTFPYGELPLDKSWDSMPSIKDIGVSRNNARGEYSGEEKQYMLKEIPIAPLNNKVDWLAAIRGRRDHHGRHQENFDKKVWKNDLVQKSLKGVVSTLTLFGPFKYVPFWTADRLMGLSVQANFFEAGKTAGHWLPWPEQLRTEDNPPNYSREKDRRYALAEILILRQFPDFGYIWNLVVLDKRNGIFTIYFPRKIFGGVGNFFRSITKKLSFGAPKTLQ